ncbi:hypothetical protein IAU60_002725 [Kwoniella sp. DSM 27419]
MDGRSRPHGLPARPAFATPEVDSASIAGPSQPRPRHQQTYGGSSSASQSAVNISGGHQPQPYGYQAYGGYTTQQAFPYMPQANLSGGYPGYNPYPQQQFPYQAQSFGQSLFQSVPATNAAGYAYSATYAQPAGGPAAPPPTKRARPNAAAVASSSGGGGKGSEQAWRNCSQPGCKFVGPGSEVEIHEGDRHLLFPRGKPVERSEEEERYAKRKGPPLPIQGTNITLETPEDIERWIAERKARWPSAKRIQEKEEERKAAIARGDIPPRGGGRGWGRGRGGRFDAASLAEEWGRAPRDPADSALETADREQRRDSGRGRGRGQDRGGGRGRGRGRGGYTEGSRDQGWARPAQVTEAPVPQGGLPTPAVTAPIAGLATLGGYDTPSDGSVDGDSGSESESESDSSSSISSSSESDTDSGEDEAGLPSEADAVLLQERPEGGMVGGAIQKDAPDQVVNTKEPATASAQPPKICKFFAKNGRCRNGDKCKFLHSKEGAMSAPGGSSSTRPIEERKQPPRQPMTKRANPFARPSMLGSLLANPIENTISQLSQTIRFLVANDFLRGVELKPGDADAEEREKTKVVPVGPGEIALDNDTVLTETEAVLPDDQAVLLQ